MSTGTQPASPAPRPRFPPTRAAGRGPGWYRGDCHVHSARSNGGELTPEQLAVDARTLGLDFIAVTEHNTCDTHGLWGQLAGDDLLVILGQEVTTRTGHWLALGIKPEATVEWRYGNPDGVIDRYLDRVHHDGGLCVAAHPYAPYPSGLLEYPLRHFDLVEVWNGLWQSDLPWNADNEAALAEWGQALAAGVRSGRWQPAIGNSDTHLAGQLGVPHTVVFAEELTTPAVLTGLRSGRSWIAGTTAVELSFQATAGDRSAEIGAHLHTHGRPALVRLDVNGVPAGRVSLHSARGEVYAAPLSPGNGPTVVQWRTSARETSFIRAEVRHPDGSMAALTNPIVLT